MFVNIPIIKNKSYDPKTKQIIIEKGTLEVNVDTSLLAHLKWEEEFQEQMKCNLNEYTYRIQKLHDNHQIGKAEMLSVLKLLYCYLHSEQVPSFKKFLSMLDYEVGNEILEILCDVLNATGKGATNQKKY